MHPVTFELYLLSTQEGSNVPLKLKLSGAGANIQSVICFKM